MKKGLSIVALVMASALILSSCDFNLFGSTKKETVKKVSTDEIGAFKFKKANASAIKVAWKKSANATKYTLLRSEEQEDGTMSPYTKCADVESDQTKYVDKNLDSGKIYGYKIYAYHSDTDSKTKTDYTTNSRPLTTKGITKLPATEKIKLEKASYKAIVIKWRGIQGAKKYVIYRKHGDGSYVKYDKTTDTSFKDIDITSGDSYTYKIVGVRKYNKKLLVSPAKEYKVPGSATEVKGLTASLMIDRVTLNWTMSGGSYKVYLKNSKGNTTLLGTTSSKSFTTSKLKTTGRAEFIVKSGSKKKAVSVMLDHSAYGKKVGKSYIEVSISSQTMNMYLNGKLYVTTPVVTGNDSDGRRTTKGYHKIISIKSPAILKGSFGGSSWNTKVNYWLGFTYSGQGVHDSTWRTSGYGGHIYQGNGSHGCVNTPINAVAKMYKKAFYGMPVIVY